MQTVYVRANICFRKPQLKSDVSIPLTENKNTTKIIFRYLFSSRSIRFFFGKFGSRHYLHPPFETVITKHECVIKDGDGIYLFKAQYPHANSRGRPPYTSLKNKLREFNKRRKHFPLGDHSVNSDSVCS